MMKVEAVLRPEKFNDVANALVDNGFLGMTMVEAQGRGRQKGVKRLWRGREYRVNLWPKVYLTLLVNDADVPKVIDIVNAASGTGEVGDGIIFATPVHTLVRIRTKEKGPEAL